MLSAFIVAAALSAAPAHELSLGPSVAWDSKFTHHQGTSLSYAFSLAPGLHAFTSWREHWFADTSRFTRELIERVREQPQAATQVLLRRSIVVGLGVQPVHLRLADGSEVKLSLRVGAGYGDTSVPLMPRVFGRIGPRMTGFSALEVSYAATDWLTFKGSFDHHFFTAYVDRVNGCDTSDLDTIARALRAARPVDSECDAAAFEEQSSRVPFALNVTRSPTSDTINIRALSFAAAFRF